MQTSYDPAKEPPPPLELKPVPPLAATPLSIQSSSSLSEDFLSRQDLFLSPGASTLALYKNPFKADLIEGAVAVDGDYSTLKRDPNGGTWRLEKYDDPHSSLAGCTEVVSVVYPDGSVGVVASTPDWFNYIHITKAGPEFVNADPIKGVSNLKVAYTPPLPQRIPVVYGATLDGNLVATRWSPTEHTYHQAYTFDVGGSLSSGDFVLSSFNWADHVLMTVVDGHLTWYTIDLNGSQAVGGPYRNNSGFIVRQILMGYQSDYGNIEAVVLGLDNRLYLARDLQHSGRFEVIGNNVFASSGTGVRDADSLMHLYLIDGDHKLSVLHQIGWRADRTPLFTMAALKGNPVPVAIPLASGVSSVVVDQYPIDHPVLTAFAATGAADEPPAPVRLIGQDAATLQWWNEAVQLADNHFYQVSRWHTRVTVLDRDGQPVPLYYLSLHAETTCTVDVGGETYVLDPRRRTHVEVQADLRGQIVFSSPALGLTAPAITISAEGLAASAEIRPDAQVQSYLAGTGKLPFKSAFDGPTLQNATIDGRPLVPPHVWTEKQTAAGAVQAMQSMIALGDPNMPKPKFAGFVFQAYAADRPGFQVFATPEELEAARAHLRGLPHFGGWWDDATDFANDVWEGVKTGAVAVACAVADVARKTLDLAINIGGKLYTLANLAIETLADAFNAVTAAFNMLLAKARDVIEWLRRAFSFEDMWNTQKAINQALHLMTPLLAGYVTKARSFVDESFFNRLPAKIDAAFMAIGGRFDNVIMGELNLTDGEPSFLTRTGQVLLYVNETAEMLIDPLAMWLWDKLLGPWANQLAEALPSIMLPPLAPLLAPARRLLAALEGILSNLESIFSDLYEWITSAISSQGVGQVESFKSALFNGLFSVLRKISLAGVHMLQAIFDSLLDVLMAAVELFGKFFDSAINLGVISAVWQWFQEQVGIAAADQSPLTIGGLFSLIAAVPATVLYKLIYGAEAQPFPNGVIPTSQQTSGATNTRIGDACVLTGMAAAILNSVLQFACDAYGAITAFSPKSSALPPLVRRVEFLLGAGTIMLTAVAGALAWPSVSGIPGSEPDFTTPGGIALFTNWLVGSVVPPALDFLFMVISSDIQKNESNGLVMQFVDPAGVFLDAGLGFVNLITGILESSLGDESELQWVANIFQPMSSIFLPLRSALAIRQPWGGVALGLKQFTDVIALLGANFRWAFMPSLRLAGPMAIPGA